MPAVSRKTTGMPPSAMVPSTMSRVVPGTGDTIARSAPSSAFSKVDFPAFGAPASTTVTPWWMARARSVNASISSTPAASRVTSDHACPDARPTCSSGKSSATSSPAITSSNSLRSRSTRVPSSPASARAASVTARSVRAPIISATASARVRSMRPFRNARRVNSPGSARRAPRSRASSTIIRKSAGLP